MANDVDWLRCRLRTALMLPLFALPALSCNSASPAGSGGPCSIPMQWCGDPSSVTGARLGARSELDCPSTVRGSDVEEARAHRDAGVYDGPPTYVAASLSPKLTRDQRTAGGGATTCCYEWEDSCPGGRPLLDDAGRARVAPVATGSDWLGARAAPPRPVQDRTRRALARAWLRDARLEHASIASFSRATLELLALGAPPTLIAGCQRAALDEVRHAQQCFALASHYARRSLRPGPLSPAWPRDASFARLARDTFVEGCFGETVAALAAARSAAAAGDPRVKSVLEGIADDEAEHAALAWSTLRWALDRDRGAVLGALEHVADELHRELSAGRAVAESDQALAAHGRLDASTLERTRSDAWQQIISPLLAELGVRLSALSG